eukprot:g65562.t1
MVPLVEAREGTVSNTQKKVKTKNILCERLSLYNFEKLYFRRKETNVEHRLLRVVLVPLINLSFPQSCQQDLHRTLPASFVLKTKL